VKTDLFKVAENNVLCFLQSMNVWWGPAGGGGRVPPKEYTRLRSPGSGRDDLKQGHGQNLTRQSS
jgi:hypothetical protein